MNTPQEAALDQQAFNGDVLVGWYQDLTQQQVEIRNLRLALGQIEASTAALAAGIDQESVAKNARPTDDQLAALGFEAMLAFNVTQKIEETGHSLTEKNEMYGASFREHYLGRAVLVRTIEPRYDAIYRHARKRGMLWGMGYVEEAEGFLSNTPPWRGLQFPGTTRPLGLYLPSRFGKKTKERFEVRVVDEDAHPLVSIELRDDIPAREVS